MLSEIYNDKYFHYIFILCNFYGNQYKHYNYIV